MSKGFSAERYINTLCIVLLLALVGVGFAVMYKTTESNTVTVDVARIQAQNKSRVVREVALLTVEIRNLEKDMDTVLETLNKIKDEIKEKTAKKRLK